jgi:predicted AAA+ superfamily ATPase
VIARARADPRGFLDEVRLPAILDEIQNVPELFGYVRARIDAAPRRHGHWLFTGSQEAPLMAGVTESMAGRAAIFQLLPLALGESPRVSLLRGGFPEVLSRPRAASIWFRSYVQTYLERDVRSLIAVRDLTTFRRFLALVASRIGQVLNKSDLAAPLGVTIPTIGAWLGVLETTAQILLIPPFYENLGKRLIKSPKLYFADSGLACHLLGIETERDFARSPFRGPLFESFVAAEIVKAQVNGGRARALYFFRDQQGLEVDFVVPKDVGRVRLVEVKASKTVFPADATNIGRLAQAMVGRYEVESFVVHAASATAETRALRPGVRAVSLSDFIARF